MARTAGRLAGTPADNLALNAYRQRHKDSQIEIKKDVTLLKKTAGFFTTPTAEEINKLRKAYAAQGRLGKAIDILEKNKARAVEMQRSQTVQKEVKKKRKYTKSKKWFEAQNRRKLLKGDKD